MVWINCTNLFDAAAGFGGYRESGYGREGGREGMWEYLTAMEDGRSKMENGRRKPGAGSRTTVAATSGLRVPASASQIDRTAKLFIGGKQARPDSGYSIPILDAKGRLTAGEVGEGNRKDAIRNAVEAARGAAAGWARSTGHNRGQILYFIAENLSARSAEFAARVRQLTGRDGRSEVDAAIARLFTYAAWADKWDGQVHQTPIRGVTLAMNEPIGVLGVAAPTDYPLLGFVSSVAPAIAAGNVVVAVPSEQQPLAVTDFYQVLETSDVPAGVVNIVTGRRDELAKVLAEHDDVDALWYFGSADGVRACELASVGNMKQTWCEGTTRDWMSAAHGEGREFLRKATQVKNIWIQPYRRAVRVCSTLISARPRRDGEFDRLPARPARTESARRRSIHAAARVWIVAWKVANHSRGLLRRPPLRPAREARVQRVGRAAKTLALGEARVLTRTGGLDDRCDRGVAVVNGARAKRGNEVSKLPYEELTAGELRARFPALRPPDDTVAIWEPRAGVLDPEAAIEAQLSVARTARAELRFGEESHQVARDGRRRGSHDAQRHVCRGAARDHRGIVDGRAPSPSSRSH